MGRNYKKNGRVWRRAGGAAPTPVEGTGGNLQIDGGAPPKGFIGS